MFLKYVFQLLEYLGNFVFHWPEISSKIKNYFDCLLHYGNQINQIIIVMCFNATVAHTILVLSVESAIASYQTTMVLLTRSYIRAIVGISNKTHHIKSV